MHIFFKLAWTARALLYKAFFGRFSIPGYIGSPTFLLGTKRMFFSSKVRIFPGLRAECHEHGRIFIHQNVTIGQGFHITCMGDLHIGEGTIISGLVTVTDIDHEYRSIDVPVFNQPKVYSKTEIGKNCFIGMGARVQAGTILGKGCIVGANSVVRGEFPNYCVIVGSPAKIVKKYNFEAQQWQRYKSS